MRRLPGDLSLKDYVSRVVRVNHAGEYGAARIYRGQWDVLSRRGSPAAELVKEMGEQEREHLDYFTAVMARRQIRPTALRPFWHVAGYALGAATAMLGDKAAMACTVAVEEAIDEHYASQIAALQDTDETELLERIAAFREDELHHRDVGYENGAEEAPAYAMLSSAIKAGAKIAIEIAKRI
ncbi:MAG: demethoxyubiquinone hydroxylase family protein [Rickettsiales bacterium]